MSLFDIFKNKQPEHGINNEDSSSGKNQEQEKR